MDCPPDRVRAKPGNLMDSIKLRILRDTGPSLPSVKFLFQCKDVLEQEGWLEAFEHLNPFAPIPQRTLNRDPTGIAVSQELDAINLRFPAILQQLTLVGERLMVKKKKKNVRHGKVLIENR